ncbi:MAG: HAD family phosphatase [Actinobacteria bacterium]|nr:HAD family phosphatase [Actinomycetota bacterium]
MLVTSPFELIRNSGIAAGHDGDELLALMLGPYDEDTDHPWHRVERGEIPLTEYGAWLVGEAEARGLTLPHRVLADMKPRDAMVERAAQLRADGYRTAVLTNNAREVGDNWRAIIPVDELFDVVVDSCMVGMRKPNPAIYTHAAERLGVAVDRCVFLDDAPGNIVGAQTAGMRAILVGLDVEPALAELDAALAGNSV